MTLKICCFNAFILLAGCGRAEPVETRIPAPTFTSADQRAADIIPAEGYGLPLDKWNYPNLPPGMIRLSHRNGINHDMRHYDKFHIIHDVSTNAFVASPAWTPSDGKPAPLATHEAYAVYLEWRKTQPENNRWIPVHDEIKLVSERLRVEQDGRYKEVARRWFYKISFHFGFPAPENSVYILLDGTLVEPWTVDVRTDAEKKEDEKQWRMRRRIWH